MARFVAIAAMSLAVLSPGAVNADPFSILSPVRVVAYTASLAERSAFVGIRRSNLRAVSSVACHTRCSDVFRRDRIRIWSASTQSAWFLLPPRLLGAAADPQIAGTY